MERSGHDRGPGHVAGNQPELHRKPGGARTRGRRSCGGCPAPQSRTTSRPGLHELLVPVRYGGVHRLRGTWHTGIAHLVPDDDPHERLRSLPQFNSFGVRTFGTNLLTIRIELTD